MENKNKNTVKNIVIAFVAIIIVAGLGSLFVNLGMAWFESLDKPSQWIPSFVIPIVWTVVYSLFAIVLFFWLRKGSLPKDVVVLLIINGVLNLLWCLVFFTFKQLFLGNVVIIINVLFAIKLIFDIAKDKKGFAILLSLFPIWLCVAASLNMAVWILN